MFGCLKIVSKTLSFENWYFELSGIQAFGALSCMGFLDKLSIIYLWHFGHSQLKARIVYKENHVARNNLRLSKDRAECANCSWEAKKRHHVTAF